MAITYDLPNIHVRFEPEVYDRLKADAEANERKLPAQIRWIVNQHYKQEASK